MKKIAALVLAVAASTAFAQPRLGHLPGSRRFPTPLRIADCAPTTPPGTLCRWPTNAFVLLVGTSSGLPARQVAIIEGPLLVPMDPRAIRITQTIRFAESWWICETGSPAGDFSAEITADGWCAVTP